MNPRGAIALYLIALAAAGAVVFGIFTALVECLERMHR